MKAKAFSIIHRHIELGKLVAREVQSLKCLLDERMHGKVTRETFQARIKQIGS